jgi:hypothetical protein
VSFAIERRLVVGHTNGLAMADLVRAAVVEDALVLSLDTDLLDVA